VLQAVYVDLDGTLLGPGGALFKDAAGGFSLLAARAIEACERAGAEVVVMTGRRQAQAMELARLLAQTAYIFEAGACVVFDGEEHWQTAPLLPREGARGSIHDQIEDAGVPKLLLDHFRGRLEYHDPWHHGREVSHLFRGLVDVKEADALLAEHGHQGQRLLDNGGVFRRSADLADLPQVRAYHLLPSGASKAGGVAFHQRARGYDPARCIAVGDSREDLQTAAHVGTFWLVANGLEKDPSISADLAAFANTRVAEASHGAGVYEAVIETLARRDWGQV
jgi:hydroxymethylpyrimidine pyrophosphatase-like HAD family hydrolase